MTEPTVPAYEPLPLRRHIAAAMVVIAVVLLLGTGVSWSSARECYGSEGACTAVPPAVKMLVGMGLTGSVGLVFGAVLMWLPLRQQSS